MNCVPDGPLHTVFTVIAMFTAGLKRIVQVRVREEPVKMLPTVEAVIVTVFGGGTK